MCSTYECKTMSHAAQKLQSTLVELGRQININLALCVH